jgi:hypothetical protein
MGRFFFVQSIFLASIFIAVARLVWIRSARPLTIENVQSTFTIENVQSTQIEVPLWMLPVKPLGPIGGKTIP